MVREDQVAAAALHVEAARRGGRRAMAVHSMCQPGRPAGSRGRRVPRRLARPRGLPQQAVERVLLARPLGVAAALGEQREHGLVVEVADTAEARVACTAK